MNREYDLTIFGSNRGGTLHSIKFTDSDLCEYDKFLDNPRNRNHKRYYDVTELVLEMIKESGFTVDFLDYRVDTRNVSVCHIKEEVASNLRLYFLVDNPKLSIVGGGGIKPWHARTYQAVSACNSAVKLLKHTYGEIQKRLLSGEIILVQMDDATQEYEGNLRFNYPWE